MTKISNKKFIQKAFDLAREHEDKSIELREIGKDLCRILDVKRSEIKQ